MGSTQKLSAKPDQFSILMTSGTHGSGLRSVFASLALRLRECGLPVTIFAGPGEQIPGLRIRLESAGCPVVMDAVMGMATPDDRKNAARIMTEHITTPQVALLGFSIRDALVFRQVKMWCKANNVACVASVQVYSLGHKQRLWPLFYLLGGQIYRRSIDHVFAAAEIERRKMVQFGLPKRMTSVVHLPIDDEWIFDTDVQRDSGENTDPSLPIDESAYPKLVFLGQFNRIKDQKTLVKMMPQVLQRYPQAKLILAGDGPYYQRSIQLAQSMGLTDSVQFLGRIAQSAVPALLRRCDVAVVSSQVETFGYCIVEPMLFDLPVISTYTGIAGELFDLQAIEVYKKGTPSDAAEKVIDTLNRLEDARARTAVGKSYVLENCLADAVASQMLATWDLIFTRKYQDVEQPEMIVHASD